MVKIEAGLGTKSQVSLGMARSVLGFQEREVFFAFVVPQEANNPCLLSPLSLHLPCALHEAFVVPQLQRLVQVEHISQKGTAVARGKICYFWTSPN